MANDWTTLNDLPVQEWETKELTAAREAAQAEITAILTERARIDEQQQAAIDAPLETLTLEQMEAARKATGDRFKLLQRELALRKGLLAQYMKDDRQAAGRASGQSSRDLTAFEEQLTNDLIGLGYKKTTALRHQGEINQGYLLGHPQHYELRQKQERMSEYSRSYDWQHENNARIDTIQRALESARRSLIA